MKRELTIFTVCNLTYLPKALTLGFSINKHQSDSLTVFIFDKKTELINIPDYINIKWIDDIGFSELDKLSFIYDVIEFTTSLKPYITLSLLKVSKKVIFLDPDTYLFSNLNCINSLLEKHPVILTPHHIKPQPDGEDESDLPMMRFGSFNLGFFAVNDTDQAKEFLNWWNKRCLKYSFMESQFGLSTDQKWVTIAPCFFDFLHISFNPGLNFAAWNTFERMITEVNDNGVYMVNKIYPLIFFHFSNFSHDDPQYDLKKASSEVGCKYPFLLEIATQYSILLNKYEKEYIFKKYAYDYMSDGSYISPTLRRAVCSVYDTLQIVDPFDSDGAVGSFAKRNKLLQKKSFQKYRYASLKDSNKYKKLYKLSYICLRVILVVFGPNKFYDFSKFLVHISIYRKHPHLWR